MFLYLYLKINKYKNKKQILNKFRYLFEIIELIFTKLI